jgi:hypothetical protein
VQATLYTIDTEKEKFIRLGRAYPFSELKENECLVSKKLADMLQIKKGEYAMLFGSYYDYYGSFKEKYEYEKEGYHNDTYNGERTGNSYYMLSINSRRYLPCIVAGFLEDSYGKFSDGSMDRVIIMEHKYFFRNIAYELSPTMFEFIPSMYIANPDEFVYEVHINYPNRLDVYLDSNYENI